MKRTLAVICAALGMAILAAEEQAPAPQQEFVYSVVQNDYELDPHHAYSSQEAQIFTAVHEGLFVYDPQTLDPQPAICEKFTRSPDKLTYTFNLRAQAKFSDGSPITAESFKSSWLHMLSPAVKSEYSSLFDPIKGAQAFRLGKEKDPNKVGIRVKSDRELEVELSAPAAYFTKLLCHHTFSVLSPQGLQSGAWEKPIGIPTSGPFKFSSVSDSGYVLVKNDQYWDAASVLLPSIKVAFAKDSQEDLVTQSFNTGETHWLSGPMNLDKILDVGTINVTRPLFSTNYLFFLCDKKPWSNADLRKALLLLLPWDQIRSQERYTVPADTLVINLQGYPKASGITKTDIDQAKKLLAKAGFKNGKGLPEIVIHLPEGESQKDLADLCIKAWADAGIKARFDAVDPATYFNSLNTHDYTIASMTWIGDFADPLTFLQMWGSSSNLNNAAYSDKRFDDLITRSMTEEGAKRLKTLSEAESVLLDSGACVPLYHSLAINVISTDSIGGWYNNPLDIHPFKFIHFISEQPIDGIIKANGDKPSAKAVAYWGN
jgi:peptide/nickel transport system substrate-binding protein/oligopeptide transport system substrate-binding protein